MDKRCIPVTHFDMEQVLVVLHLCLFLLLEDGTADKRCQQTYIIEELFHNVYLVMNPITKVLLYSCQKSTPVLLSKKYSCTPVKKYSCTPVKKVLLYSCQKSTPVLLSKKVLLYSCQKKYSCTPVKKVLLSQGILGYCSKSGLRFSKNALPPSCASSRK